MRDAISETSHYNEYDYLVINDDFVNKIKQSIPGEALIFGNCVSMPLHVTINKASPEPNSKNCVVSEEWFGSNCKKRTKSVTHDGTRSVSMTQIIRSVKRR